MKICGLICIVNKESFFVFKDELYFLCLNVIEKLLLLFKFLDWYVDLGKFFMLFNFIIVFDVISFNFFFVCVLYCFELRDVSIFGNLKLLIWVY